MQIKRFFFIILFIAIPATYTMRHHVHKKEFVLILDPAGDAKKTGRAIGDSFERGLTLQYAEKIKDLIERQLPHVKIIITRLPGDIVYDLQNASLANRINADLFISINFYLSADTKPTLFLYQFSYGNDFAPHQSGLSLNTYDQAYKTNKVATDEMLKLFTKHLMRNNYKNIFTLSGPHSLPVKPLIGITTPSIAIEAGLKNKESWHMFIDPLVTAIVSAIEQQE